MNSFGRYKLILASGSPRRKELLAHLEIPFEIVVSDIEEISEHTEPVAFGEDIARAKGEAVCQELAARADFAKSFYPLVVAADTLVALGEKIYGKPKHVDEAREILRELAGETHQVVTSVFLARLDLETKAWVQRVFSVSTMVTFKDMSEDILEAYLATGDCLDKAGAYGIQKQGLTFVDKLEGSYSNVVGFPLTDFIDELRSFLGFLNDRSGKWRELFERA